MDMVSRGSPEGNEGREELVPVSRGVEEHAGVRMSSRGRGVGVSFRPEAGSRSPERGGGGGIGGRLDGAPRLPPLRNVALIGSMDESDEEDAIDE